LAVEEQEQLGIHIRPANHADAAALAVLSTQLGYPTSEDEARRRLTQIAGNPENLILVAEQPEGRVIGWLNAYLCQLVESDLHAEIGGLVVDEEYRGSGTGRLLMRHAEQWAREKNCRTVSLRSNIIRERAHEFYQRLGYQIVKTQHAFRKIL
jgi:GNAT superfamily N-acetyltransferase